MRSLLVAGLALAGACLLVSAPGVVSSPAANPLDPSNEDLTRVIFKSQEQIPWQAHFIRPNETLESLFGRDWVTVARFNRVDRRHAYPGMTIKVPLDLAAARDYQPLPREYAPARRYRKYLLLSLDEQWLAAYEFGKLKFSMPAATGADGHETPTGKFFVSARHRNHTSSLYQTEDKSQQYPMDNAIRFHIGKDNVAYWLHARDIPGRPASHGCVGLYDEAMQKRTYDTPANPMLLDAQKVYAWAVGEEEYPEDSGELEELEDGLPVEVVGRNPGMRSTTLRFAGSLLH